VLQGRGVKWTRNTTTKRKLHITEETAWEASVDGPTASGGKGRGKLRGNWCNLANPGGCTLGEELLCGRGTIGGKGRKKNNSIASGHFSHRGGL